MKMYIVKQQQEHEYKIFRVEDEEKVAFIKEHGKNVIAEADNLGDLINKFQDLNVEKMNINPEISTMKRRGEDDLEDNRLKRRQRQQ